jgi:hypothetical protein
MRSKTVLACLSAVLLLAISPALAPAQITGFRVVNPPQAQFGIPPLAFPPAQFPAAPFGGHFAGVPPFIGGFGVPFAPVVRPFVPFPTVIIPNQVLLPGQTIVQPPVFAGPPPQTAPVQVVAPPSVILAPRQPIHPGAPAVPHGPPMMPRPGTPRADVIREFGPPSVTVITSSGETLFFPGGGSVIIQNGQVVGPK